ERRRHPFFSSEAPYVVLSNIAQGLHVVRESTDARKELAAIKRWPFTALVRFSSSNCGSLFFANQFDDPERAERLPAVDTGQRDYDFRAVVDSDSVTGNRLRDRSAATAAPTSWAMMKPGT